MGIQMGLFISCVRVSHSQQRQQCNVGVFRSSIIMFCLFIDFLWPHTFESLRNKLPSYYWYMGAAEATTQLFIRRVLGWNGFVLRINNKQLPDAQPLTYYLFRDCKSHPTLKGKYVIPWFFLRTSKKKKKKKKNNCILQALEACFVFHGFRNTF